MNSKNFYDYPSEPYYDDEELDRIKEHQIYELINRLFSDINNLESEVIKLRQEVNNLTPGQHKPYADLYSDICKECHDDHPAMAKYFELFGEE